MSAIVAYRNWFDGVGSILPWTFNYSGLGYPDALQPVTGYPAENLRTRQLSNVARFERVPGGAVTGPCAVELVAPSAQPVSIIAVIGIDLPDSVLYKPSGGSYVSLALVTGYSSLLGIPGQGFVFVPPGTLVEKVQLYWNTIPDGDYFEQSRVFIADALLLPTGVDSGWSLTVDDPGRLDVSAGRQWYESKLPRTRLLSVSARPLTTEQAFGISAEGTTIPSFFPVPSVQDLQFHAGATGEVVVIPRTDGQWAYRAGVYGHLERPPVLRHLAGPNYAADFNVIEER